MLLRELQATAARSRRLTVLRNRLDRDRARSDTRDWVQQRRARTRQLIELGGLVQKAGLVELVDDDRATLLGAFLELADQLRHGQRERKRLNAKKKAAAILAHAGDGADCGCSRPIGMPPPIRQR